MKHSVNHQWREMADLMDYVVLLISLLSSGKGEFTFGGMDSKQVEALCRQKVEELAEFFPHIVLLVSWEEKGDTRTFFQGSGNHNAKIGMAHRFLDTEKSRDHFMFMPVPEDKGGFQ